MFNEFVVNGYEFVKSIVCVVGDEFYGENGVKVGFVVFCGKLCVNEIVWCVKWFVVLMGRELLDCYVLCVGVVW